jgi:hypothetical protein
VKSWERWSINMFIFNSSDIVTPIDNHDDEVGAPLTDLPSLRARACMTGASAGAPQAWISHVLPERAGKVGRLRCMQ